MITTTFLNLLQQGWASTFARGASHRRAIEQALSSLCVFGRRTLSRLLCGLGRHQRDWSADYKLFSRSPWDADTLFRPVLEAYRLRFPEGPIVVPLDDTILPKSGSRIPRATWLRDPQGPPFQVNLIRGLRFVQASVIFPFYREGDQAPRSLPVRFREAPPLPKPGKRAPAEAWPAYREAKKQHSLPLTGREVIGGLRADLDAQGAADRRLLVALDGSYCNRTMFRDPLDRVDLVARCRWDARLCFAAPPGTGRKYAPEKFSPAGVRQDASSPWATATVYYGGQWREVRYKEVNRVLWQRGALTRPLRLLVLAPQPYKPAPRAKTLYRDPAYLLSTDVHSAPVELVQAYLDRWQIECNHRDEKDILGVGQAQVRASASVARQPAFTVAAYSLLLLAGLMEFGPSRTDDYLPLPAWRKKPSRRPSILDLVAVMRQEIHETPELESPFAEIFENIAKFSPLYAST